MSMRRGPADAVLTDIGSELFEVHDQANQIPDPETNSANISNQGAVPPEPSNNTGNLDESHLTPPKLTARHFSDAPNHKNAQRITLPQPSQMQPAAHNVLSTHDQVDDGNRTSSEPFPHPDNPITDDRNFDDEDHNRNQKKPTVTRRYIIPSLAGFFLGIVFWHFVGFWNFVSEAVFSGPREKIALEQISKKNGATSGIETGSINTTGRNNAVVGATSCTTLAYDAASDRTHLVPCPLGKEPTPSSQPGFTHARTDLNQNNNSTDTETSTWQTNTRVNVENNEPQDFW